MLAAAVLLAAPPGATAQPPQDVTVVNGATAPVPVRDVEVDARALRAVQASMDLDLPAQAQAPSRTVLTVAAATRLVIEQVTWRVRVPTGETATVSLVTTAGGTLAEHSFQTARQSKNGPGQDEFVASHPVRLYADPGTPVRMFVRRQGPDGTAVGGPGSARLTISGYSVPLP
jgi:hypothetical protein